MTIDEFLDIRIATLNKRYRCILDLQEEVNSFSGLKRKDKKIKKKSTNSFGIYWVSVNLTPNDSEYDVITLTFLKSGEMSLYPAIILNFRYYENHLIALEKVWFRVSKGVSGTRRSHFFHGPDTIRSVIGSIVRESQIVQDRFL